MNPTINPTLSSLSRHFGYESQSKDGQLVKYMFTNMRGDKWRKVRGMMSGVFTSGKLKMMTNHIVKAAEQMEDHLETLEKEGKEVEIRDLTSTFAMDAFASSGFGIEQNSFQEPDNVFRRMALSLVGAPGYSTGSDQARIMFIMTFPGDQAVLFFSMIINHLQFIRTFQTTGNTQLSYKAYSIHVRHHREDLPPEEGDQSQAE